MRAVILGIFVCTLAACAHTRVPLASNLDDHATADSAMEKWTVGVDGVGCPFCAYGLEKKLGAVPGVTSFHFRFVDAEIDIGAARGATVTPDALADAVDKAGFGLRSLVIVGAGAVVTGSDGKVLKIGGLSLPLLDYDGPEGTATVRGELERSNGQWRIRIIPPGK